MTTSPTTPRQLMIDAFLRKPTERIPCMPQICYDVCLRIYETEFEGDWMDGLARCIERPETVYDLVIRLVEETGCDGLRLFPPADPMKLKRLDNQLIVLDPRTGERTGRIDTMGGGKYMPDNPAPPVETLDEAKKRIRQMNDDLTDEKLEWLRNARARVPERFVASAPGGLTMNTYNDLRGRVQGMIDFFERPDFVSACMDMQADAIIQRGEKLLTTGIDCFYIGDPSSSGSLIGPWHFEQFCLPGYKKFCKHFADKDILMYIHVCGNSNPILEMLADTGVHVVEPLDPLGGVAVADAKQRIGHKVGLMGGVNTLNLCMGTPKSVEEESIQKCREGGPTGYILAAGDMVPPEATLANLQALVDVSTKSLWRDGAGA